MKKIICLFSLLLALMTMNSPALAAGSSYDLPEIDLSVTIPDSFVVITKDTIDSVINEYIGENLNTSEREALKETLLAPGTYMILWSQNDFEATIAVQENPYKNESFVNYSDSQIKEEYGEGVKLTLEQRGATVIGAPEVYQHPQIKMCKVAYSLTTEGNTRYLLSYTTVLNGKIYNFLFSSNKPILHQSNAVTAREIIDGIHFNRMSSSNSESTGGYLINTRTENNAFLGSGIGAILLGLIITFVIHPLPIIVYRYGIKQEPIAPNKATKIAVIDAIIVFLLWVVISIIFISGTESALSFVSTPAIIVWAFICRRILTNGYYQAPNKEEKAESIVKGTCEYNGVMGTLDCGNTFIRYTSATLRETQFRFEDGIKVSLDNDIVTIIDKNNDEYIFKVKSPELFRKKIENYNKSPQQFEGHTKAIDTSSLEMLSLEDDKSQGSALETKKEGEKSIKQPDNSIKANNSSSLIESSSEETYQQGTSRDILFCRKCGSKLIKGSAFCRKCGTPIIDNKDLSIKKPENTLKKNSFIERLQNKGSLIQKNGSFSKKLDLAYKHYKPEMVDMLFPGGMEQAGKIIKSLSQIYNLDLDTSDEKTYFEVLSTYTDVVIRRVVTQSSDEHILTSLQIKHPELVKNKDAAKRALAFITLNMNDHNYSLDSENDIAMTDFVAATYSKAEETVKENLVAETENLDDPEYGLVETKPIFTQGVSGSNKYLQSLRTLSGAELKWVRLGSTSAPGINGMVDIYESTLPSGEKYKTLYLNMYGAANSIAIPKGFIHKSMSLDRTEVQIKSEYNEKKEQPKTEVKTIEYIFCRKCGKKIPADSEFCTHCGTTVIHLE